VLEYYVQELFWCRFSLLFETMSANQSMFKTTCKTVFYLAWRLIDPAAELKLFVFRTSNLSPSKEGGREIAVMRNGWMPMSGRPFR
jgi:hypothetical protein